mmetsp:Transcript_3636/g.10557  ORF Transcript_3636/g.10557 Transcript_3636/m.10557 type:complete len:356 (-) Transcript_3636:2158-3225(-)
MESSSVRRAPRRPGPFPASSEPAAPAAVVFWSSGSPYTLRAILLTSTSTDVALAALLVRIPGGTMTSPAPPVKPGVGRVAFSTSLGKPRWAKTPIRSADAKVPRSPLATPTRMAAPRPLTTAKVSPLMAARISSSALSASAPSTPFADAKRLSTDTSSIPSVRAARTRSRTCSMPSLCSAGLSGAEVATSPRIAASVMAATRLDVGVETVRPVAARDTPSAAEAKLAVALPGATADELLSTAAAVSFTPRTACASETTIWFAADVLPMATASTASARMELTLAGSSTGTSTVMFDVCTVVRAPRLSRMTATMAGEPAGRTASSAGLRSRSDSASTRQPSLLSTALACGPHSRVSK